MTTHITLILSIHPACHPCISRPSSPFSFLSLVERRRPSPNPGALPPPLLLQLQGSVVMEKADRSGRVRPVRWLTDRSYQPRPQVRRDGGGGGGLDLASPLSPRGPPPFPFSSSSMAWGWRPGGKVAAWSSDLVGSLSPKGPPPPSPLHQCGIGWRPTAWKPALRFFLINRHV